MSETTIQTMKKEILEAIQTSSSSIKEEMNQRFEEVFEIVTFIKDNAASKEDLQEVRTGLKADIEGVRTELKSDIAEVRSELKSDIANVKEHLENTINEVLETVNTFAEQTERRLEGLGSDIGSLKLDNVSIKSTMVTKEYFDEKMTGAQNDSVVLVRKEDRKLATLVDRLRDRKVLTEEDARAIFSLEPFPQTF